MDVLLLGPVQVRVAGVPVDLGVRRQRLLFALLALEVNRVVPVARLIDLMWPVRAPASARNMVHTFVSGIRALLGGTGADGQEIVLERVGAGYLLRCDPDLIDAHRFLVLLAQARAAGGDELAVVVLERALALWRGPVLAGVATPALDGVCQPLVEARLGAQEDLAEAMIRLGRQDVVIGRLMVLVGEHPFRSRLVAALMTALYRAGRAPEALAVFDRFRTRLRDELGLDPPADLRGLHRALLRGEDVAGYPARPSAAVPRQLPAPVRHFAGRAAELAALTRLLVEARAGYTVVISSIDGTAGVGKTALAVYWAHRVAARFPDGQLYVDLRGFDRDGSILAATDAVRGFLDALGVPAPPGTAAAQAALYRSLLADRRMLIVLDNARDAEHVRPLLPGSPGSLVLVTSRNRLTSLVSMHGAEPVTLHPLDPDQARELLTHRLGAARVAAEPDAVTQIVTRCAGLPLALAIVAARAATNPGFALSVLADQLHDTHHRLDMLSAGDAASDVRTTLSWSYRALTPPAARLFRLLGLHPGPDISEPATASLAGMTIARIRPLLTELVNTNLLTEPVPGRYTCHDLLRDYATEQAHHTEPQHHRHATTHRILDHYLHTAHVADRLLDPTRPTRSPDPPVPGVVPEPLAEPGRAAAWLVAECPVLLALIHHAYPAEQDVRIWHLCRAIATFLFRRGLWSDLAATQHRAAAAACRLRDPGREATSRWMLGGAYIHLGRPDEARHQLQQANDLYGEVGDRSGQADVHYLLTRLYDGQGRLAEALDHARRSLALQRQTGDRRGLAYSLSTMGWLQTRSGEHRRAIASCEEAIAMHADLANVDGVAAALGGLGHAYQHLGDLDRALASYQRTVANYRELGDRYHEAQALALLGDCHEARGATAAARDAWQRSLHTLDELEHPNADRVRARLTAISRKSPEST